MKNFIKRISPILAIIFVLAAYGCKEMHQEHQGDIEESAALTDDDFKVLWGHIDALWEQKDISLAGNVYAENFTRVSPGGTSSSYDELSNELNAINGAYPDMTLDLKSYDLCGNRAVVHWSVNGTFTGELGGIKGNGKPFEDVVGVTIMYVEDGKIVNDESYWDTFSVFAQTGFSISAPEMESEE